MKHDKEIIRAGYSPSFEIKLTVITICITIVATVLFLGHTLEAIARYMHEGRLEKILESSAFVTIACFLVYGNLVYQLARIAFLQRLRSHRPAEREALDRFYDIEAPRLAILIPSYKEEARIVRQTLLSAALQRYPNRRVVLLIDDPPCPGSPDDMAGLVAARRLPEEVLGLLYPQAVRLDTALKGFEERARSEKTELREELDNLVKLYYEVSAWFKEKASGYPATDHTDAWFVEKTFREPAREFLERARALEDIGPGSFSVQKARREYRRLASIFKTDITSFERKRYANLSHESNKAMNLNSYISLVGGNYREAWKDGSLYVEPVGDEPPAICAPSADYLITLDADSILIPDYAIRLIQIMELDGNERLAVAQTPYSAFPGAPGTLERVAGATTDIQYLVHQGFTGHNATFWVGANALLRMAALEDIKSIEEERGLKITRYIQDRTVIEDTESSVDLAARGWKLYNYPERLAYSATPPDFGALLIQRRRWANGGLIILPKLIRHLLSGPGRLGKAREGFMRVNYLTSVAGTNLGLIVILAYPFNDNMQTVWLPLAALPYYFLYGLDLLRNGYRKGDILRVYALNLMLLPVNLGGVFKSLQQAWTGKKIPFSRTPKVQGRTRSPALYVMAEYFILAYCFLRSLEDLFHGRWTHAAFSIVNGVFFAYAVTYFIGWKESREDLVHALNAKGLYRPRLPVREPGNIPGWFQGLILLLRDEIRNDEKIVIQNGIIKIADKTPIDKFLEWVKGPQDRKIIPS